MTVSFYDVKNWALSYLRRGSNVWQYAHIAENHWNLSDEDLRERSKSKKCDVSTFRGTRKECIDLLRIVFTDRENLFRIMRWINAVSDNEDMAFITNTGHDIGTCLKEDGTLTSCRRIVFWFRKDETLMPHLASSYPVPDDYRVPSDRASNRYKFENNSI